MVLEVSIIASEIYLRLLPLRPPARSTIPSVKKSKYTKGASLSTNPVGLLLSVHVFFSGSFYYRERVAWPGSFVRHLYIPLYQRPHSPLGDP